MSSNFYAIGVENLRSPSDNRIPSFVKRVIAKSGGTLKDSTLLNYNKLGKTIKIVNNDPTDTIGYRLHSDQVDFTIIPVSSDDSLDEWFEYYEIDTSRVSKDATIEIDLVDTDDAKRLEGS